MYKAMAAYAAGLIANEDRFISAFPFAEQGIVWALDKDNKQVYINLHQAHKLSVMGAMRASQDVFTSDLRAFNSLFNHLMHYAKELYGINHIGQINHKQAIEILVLIAK